MISIVVREASGRVEEGIAPARLPALLEAKGATIWVDLSNPTPGEAAILADVFHFHPLAIEDCEAHRHHPKIDDYGTYVFILTHGVHPESSVRDFRTRQLSLFLGPNYLVSHHHQPSRSVDHTLEGLRRSAAILAEGPDMLLYRILDFQVDLYMPLMDKFQKRIDEVETQCFTATTSEILKGVFDLRRALMRLRRFAGHQREILLRLTRREFPQIDDRAAIHLRDVYDHLVRITDLAETYREIVAVALEAHLSIVSNRTNEIMRALTVVATLFIPLTFIAGVYGMNFPNIPEFGWKYGWVFAYGLMAAVGAGMYLYFRRRGIFRGPHQ